jgi:hypothetical protein
MNMSINIIKEEIDILIDTIREQHDIIKDYKGRIPQIELDIIMSNVRDLYEYLTELNKINNLRKAQQPIEVSPEIMEKLSVSKKDKTEKKQEAETTETLVESVKIPEVQTEEKPEPVSVEINNIVEEKPVIEEVKVDSENIEEIAADLVDVINNEPSEDELKIADDIIEHVEEKTEIKIQEVKKETKKASKSEKAAIIDLFAETDKTSLSDKFKDEKKSLNEKLGEEKKEKSIADKIQKKPIKDLKTAIGINDKFIFINELFKGSLQDYNKAIESINALGSGNEAFAYIEELKERYKWDEKPEIYIKLEDFVIRKFL